MSADMQGVVERAARRRILGRGNLSLTRLGLGGAPLGNLYQAVEEAEAERVIDAAWQGGVRYFDTAPLYGSGLSERRMGRALARRPRSDYVLSSKVGWLIEPGVGIRDDGLYVGLEGGPRRCDYSYDGTLRSLEASLLRLGLDYVDIVYIHDLDTVQHGAALTERYGDAMDGAYRALDRLRGEGVVGAIGLGVNEWQICDRLLADADPDCFLLAGRYSLLDQSALYSFLPACIKRGIGVVIGGAFNSGILATGAVPGARYDYMPASAEIMTHTARLEAVCHRHNVPLAAAALQFPSFHPAVVSVVPGARSAAEMATNLDLFSRIIPAALWQELRAEGLLPAEAPLGPD
ncbi:aldo/keto reductase [Ferrovibrio sp.]|uniref:aldo/keto reductase n=1 Tax=Ferrovibrio sp. TaxID=1917215 RepID=UPI0025BC2005|nr:aldo/keto reductase [Ferrovibrio sp.]